MGLEILVDIILPELPDVNCHFEDGFTCLAAVASGNRVSIVKKLLELGVDIDLPTKDRRLTPLHLAVGNACEETVEILVAAGASLHSRLCSGTTPFYRAARGGSIRILSLLHEKGSEVDATTWDNWTPLIEAVENSHESAVKLLLIWGANPKQCSRYGSIPLEMACHLARRNIYCMLEAAVGDLLGVPSFLRNSTYPSAQGSYQHVDDDPDSDSETVWWDY
ncbi:ankyrin repeat-containing domain protein [Rhexocercosporidium sp. MPI-PUGE-AT-0058]|nr:ankyrin repeat-containing domain protein [Rhexocercosporidium sp. MPI-PUGE-AT-0058]